MQFSHLSGIYYYVFTGWMCFISPKQRITGNLKPRQQGKITQWTQFYHDTSNPDKRTPYLCNIFWKQYSQIYCQDNVHKIVQLSTISTTTTITTTTTTTTILLLHLFNGNFSRTTWVSRYQKGKTSLDLMRQTMMGFWDAAASAGQPSANKHKSKQYIITTYSAQCRRSRMHSC